MDTLTVDVSELGLLTDEALYRLCLANRDLRIERTADGELVVMSPTGGETSRRNSLIIVALGQWNERSRTGIVFDSSGGFTLPNGAMRAPDAAWIEIQRWERLSKEERRKFPPLCPDFVVELMSESDGLLPAQRKMDEWIENGCRLAWLIDPSQEHAYIYRADGSRETVTSSDAPLAGEDVLPGFELALETLR